MKEGSNGRGKEEKERDMEGGREGKEGLRIKGMKEEYHGREMKE